ncbi:MAG: hypothetical protein ACD_67C00042G0001, partial [uncultured bacterium]
MVVDNFFRLFAFRKCVTIFLYKLRININTKMFDFLKGKNKCFIGVDFATSSIKVVELSYKDQHAYLENYGVVDLDLPGQGQQRSDVSGSSYDQKLNGALKSLVERMKLRPKSPAYVSIPGFSGLITIIEFPDMPQEELAN